MHNSWRQIRPQGETRGVLLNTTQIERGNQCKKTRSYEFLVVNPGYLLKKIFKYGISVYIISYPDEMPPLHPAPQTDALNTEEGYIINPITGDSIQSILNTLGDTLITVTRVNSIPTE